MNKNSPNALINETSPYLLQHAYNPVKWFPWGAEALQQAKEKDLPILVSIGYSACHWCHVMERESFEDPYVADFMNEHFINIKIDREERPDLDHLYMDAVQAISGSGGWPLNVFLTPDTRPFYGGTYFPPKKAFNRSSWMEVLAAMNDVFQKKRDEVEQQAETLVSHLRDSSGISFASKIKAGDEEIFFMAEHCQAMADKILASADKTSGGFGVAPKFLQTASINYLLAFAYLQNHEPSLAQATLTIGKMLNGGIYDQLGGGISRYSTDNDWLVPHFEKMLYDNALFVSTLSEAYQLTGDLHFKEGICETLSFIMKELKHENGGYYTAIDADSEGIEGKYYVWSKQEIDEALGEFSAIFCDYYNVTSDGNWEGENILNITQDLNSIAAKYGQDSETAERNIRDSRKMLLQLRQKRVAPGTDDKILLNCNALLLTAFCKAYAATLDKTYLDAAENLFSFIESAFFVQSSEHRLYHSYKDGKAKFPAFLDDYAYLVEGLILLQEITSNQDYLILAVDLIAIIKEQFQAENSPFFYYSMPASLISL